MCSPGYRESNIVEYTPEWITYSINTGDTLENRDECWNLAKENVQSAIGIYWNYHFPACMAIEDTTSLKPWPSSFPDYQDTTKLCILRSHIQNGNFKYILILFYSARKTYSYFNLYFNVSFNNILQIQRETDIAKTESNRAVTCCQYSITFQFPRFCWYLQPL